MSSPAARNFVSFAMIFFIPPGAKGARMRWRICTNSAHCSTGSQSGSRFFPKTGALCCFGGSAIISERSEDICSVLDVGAFAGAFASSFGGDFFLALARHSCPVLAAFLRFPLISAILASSSSACLLCQPSLFSSKNSLKTADTVACSSSATALQIRCTCSSFAGSGAAVL